MLRARDALVSVRTELINTAHKLGELIGTPGAKLLYEYDFGLVCHNGNNCEIACMLRAVAGQ